MEWEHNMDYQPRQQLANALDLSSRLAQKEQTKQQKQQQQSSLFNALCDTQDNRTQEHDNDGEEDWRRYLVSLNLFSFVDISSLKRLVKEYIKLKVRFVLDLSAKNKSLKHCRGFFF